METKICSKCKEEKPLSEFNKDKRNKDGLNHWCKKCINEYKTQYREKVYLQEKEYCEFKTCTKCNLTKSVDFFPKDNKTKDGYSQWCKDCKYPMVQKWQKNNPEKHYQGTKKYYNEHKEKYREYGRNYYNRNQELCLDRCKKYRNANIEKCKENKRNIYLKNHLKILIQGCIKRSQNNNLDYDTIDILYNKLKPIYDFGLCECCKKELSIGETRGFGTNSFSIDRIIPEKGYTVNNVAIICGECNKRKRNMTLSDMKQMVGWIESKLSQENIPPKEVAI